MWAHTAFGPISSEDQFALDKSLSNIYTFNLIKAVYIVAAIIKDTDEEK